MPTRALEEAHLFQARRHVASAQARIAIQATLVAKLAALGLDTARAEATLGIMQETLRVMLAHKALIEEVLARDDKATVERAAIHAVAMRTTLRRRNDATSRER